jgi:uncharacterized protein
MSNASWGALRLTGYDQGIFLAAPEVVAGPLHIAIVGSKTNESNKKLYAAGLAIANTYKQIEWWDEVEGKLPIHDVEYPKLDKPAAFLCTGKRCSFPIYEENGFSKLIKRNQ